jgi:flavin-dependent trigonelline monooxygenase, oxygenase component
VDFVYFLASYMPDAAYGGRRTYRDMVEQAILAERLGYSGVAIPEHHLINILMVPSPLQLAVRIASLTKNIRLITSIAVLPIRDMRIFAGEVVQAQLMCDDRIVLGVGRGAFEYEVSRLGTPIAQTRPKFAESLQVLEALLTGEEVSWKGDFYDFEPMTIMPRPTAPTPIMVAAMAPDSIYDSAKRGYHIQTTPLSGGRHLILEQVDAFRRGKADGGAKAASSRLSLQRGLYAAKDEADAKAKVMLAYDYFKRFENIRGPGIVSKGMIEALPREQTPEELAKNIIVCPPSEMIDRLSEYAEAGIEELYAPCGYGQSHAETMDMMHRFHSEVMPHFKNPRSVQAA